MYSAVDLYQRTYWNSLSAGGGRRRLYSLDAYIPDLAQMEAESRLGQIEALLFAEGEKRTSPRSHLTHPFSPTLSPYPHPPIYFSSIPLQQWRDFLRCHGNDKGWPGWLGGEWNRSLESSWLSVSNGSERYVRAYRPDVLPGLWPSAWPVNPRLWSSAVPHYGPPSTTTATLRWPVLCWAAQVSLPLP